MKIYPYNAHSASAKTLSKKLNYKRLKHKDSKWKSALPTPILNWGANELPEYLLNNHIILNHPEKVKQVTNKLLFFKKFSDKFLLPPWTDDVNEAKKWVMQDKQKAVCRTILTGHSGAGIIIVNRPEEILPAPLYTKYIKKLEEYRVHIFNNECIDVQRKMLKKNVPTDAANWSVRTHSNGFIYGREDVVFPKDEIENCIKLIKETGLMFGAIDLIFNKHLNKYFILEINTAPGLTGTTLDKYVAAIKCYIEENKKNM